MLKFEDQLWSEVIKEVFVKSVTQVIKFNEVDFATFE